MPFRTPPVSPPQSSFLRGLRRVYSLDFRHRPMNSQDSGSADPLLSSGGSSRASERSSIPQSTIYNWSCGHFSKPLLSADDDNEENISRREEKEKLALDLITKSQHCCESTGLMVHSFSHYHLSWVCHHLSKMSLIGQCLLLCLSGEQTAQSNCHLGHKV